MTDQLPPQLIIERARRHLDCARQGLADLRGPDAGRHLIGMYNAIVFGRSVTFVLQTIRTINREHFDKWYGPRQQEMRDDPLLRWFHELRNQILKEGGPEHSTHTYITGFDQSELVRLMQNPPPGARGFVIGDRLGGSGWEIELPDGSTEMLYVALPPRTAEGISISLHLPNPPASHLGMPVPGTSIDTLIGLYLDYLDRVVRDAEREFIGI